MHTGTTADDKMEMLPLQRNEIEKGRNQILKCESQLLHMCMFEYVLGFPIHCVCFGAYKATLSRGLQDGKYLKHKLKQIILLTITLNYIFIAAK